MKVLVTPLAIALLGCVPGSPEGGRQGTSAPDSHRAPDVRYEPSPLPVVRDMLQLASVGPRDVVYDLGSGDGRIPIMAAKTFGARGVGIDIDPTRVAQARENAREAGIGDRVSFRNEDLFDADFSDATVVTLFLSRDVNRRLRPILLRQLRPGTRVVSYWHDMGDWEPDRAVPTERAMIYLWTIPRR
jgi:SAM-dependent methyltransferase